MHVAPDVDAEFKILEAFDILGWAPILSLLDHTYPTLVREFHNNIVNKSGYNEEVIKSYVRGKLLTITRNTLVAHLGCSNEGPSIDLKKEFHSPNEYWDPAVAMACFDQTLDYNRTSQRSTLKASAFKPHH